MIDTVADLAVADARKWHAVLVLSDRVEHDRLPADMVAAQDIEAAMLVGCVLKKERTEILEHFRKGGLPVVVTSTLANEGLDVPILYRIILAWPGCAKGWTTQRLGRLMRPHPDKRKAVLYDLVDNRVPPLRSRYYERSKVYTSLGIGGGS